jgi:hypothetical protein
MKLKRVKLKDIKTSHCVSYENKRKTLEKNFINEGYKPKKGLISIGMDYKILNGHHRYCLLLKEYGGEHVIIVAKRNQTYFINNLILTFLSIFLLPFYLPNYFIKNYKK